MVSNVLSSCSSYQKAHCNRNFFLLTSPCIKCPCLLRSNLAFLSENGLETTIQYAFKTVFTLRRKSLSLHNHLLIDEQLFVF